MKKQIPKIDFNKNKRLDIEVITFPQLFSKLQLSKDHNPYAPHKIKFFLILMVSKNSYTHFVDFKSYTLTAGSALFVAKNQVHHFKEGSLEADGLISLVTLLPFLSSF